MGAEKRPDLVFSSRGAEAEKRVPATEQRGGDHPDWANARPGEPLQELPEPEYLEPESTDIPDLQPDEPLNGDAT